MDNIFSFAKNCLQQVDIENKLALTHQAWQLSEQNQLSFDAIIPVDPITKTCFPAQPLLLAPQKMPKRGLGSAAGIAALFHSLAALLEV